MLDRGKRFSTDIDSLAVPCGALVVASLVLLFHAAVCIMPGVDKAELALHRDAHELKQMEVVVPHRPELRTAGDLLEELAGLAGSRSRLPVPVGGLFLTSAALASLVFAFASTEGASDTICFNSRVLDLALVSPPHGTAGPRRLEPDNDAPPAGQAGTDVDERVRLPRRPVRPAPGEPREHGGAVPGGAGVPGGLQRAGGHPPGARGGAGEPGRHAGPHGGRPGGRAPPAPRRLPQPPGASQVVS